MLNMLREKNHSKHLHFTKKLPRYGLALIDFDPGYKSKDLCVCKNSLSPKTQTQLPNLLPVSFNMEFLYLRKQIIPRGLLKVNLNFLNTLKIPTYVYL